MNENFGRRLIDLVCLFFGFVLLRQTSSLDCRDSLDIKLQSFQVFNTTRLLFITQKTTANSLGEDACNLVIRLNRTAEPSEDFFFGSPLQSANNQLIFIFCNLCRQHSILFEFI